MQGITGPGGKKFPELKLMINGELKNGNNSLSSDEDLNLAVSTPFVRIIKIVAGGTKEKDSTFNYQQ